MRDLSDVLHDARDARAEALAGLTPGDATVAALRGRVRRRRVVRHTLEAAVVVPVVAGLAVGGWLVGAQPDRRDPAVPPSPTVTTPAPTPEPTPESAPTSTADPLPELVLEPGLPSYYPLTPQVLAASSPGWVLATYAPQRTTSRQRTTAAGVSAPADQLLYLVSPDGERHLATRLPIDAVDDSDQRSWTEWRVAAWEAGAPTAVMVRHAVAAGPDSTTWTPAEVVEMEVLTGAVVREVVPPVDGATWVDRSPAGVTAWEHVVDGAASLTFDGAPGASGPVTVPLGDSASSEVGWGPDGRLALVGDDVVDVATGAVVGGVEGGAPDWCRALTWWTADEVLAVCHDTDPFETTVLGSGARLVAFPAAGDGAPRVLRELSEGDAYPAYQGAVYLRDGAALVPGVAMDPAFDVSIVGACPDDVYLVPPAGPEPLAVPTPDGASDANLFGVEVVAPGTVLVEARSGCSGDQTPAWLVGVDLATGTTVELLGRPGEEVPGEGWLVAGLTSWVVGR